MRQLRSRVIIIQEGRQITRIRSADEKEKEVASIKRKASIELYRSIDKLIRKIVSLIAYILAKRNLLILLKLKTLPQIMV